MISYAQNSKNDASRLGITVTKKTGNAVERNRIKRLIREFFRKNRHLLTHNFDLNIIAKQRIRYYKNTEREDALKDVFHQLANSL